MFTDDRGVERKIDLLFSVKVKESKEEVRMLFILEHKSYQDSKVLHQILRYQTLAYNRWNWKYPVIPILVYHGREKHWKGSLKFQDSIKGLTPLLKQEFGKNILNFDCKLLNIHDIHLYGSLSKKLISRPILLIMSRIWNISDKDIQSMFEMFQAAQTNTDLSPKERRDLTEKAVDYLRAKDPKVTARIVRIEKEVVEEEYRIMPALQYSLDKEREAGHKTGLEAGIKKGIEKGREEGLEAGRQDTALRLLEEGVDAKIICRCTGLTPESVEKMREKFREKLRKENDSETE